MSPAGFAQPFDTLCSVRYAGQLLAPYSVCPDIVLDTLFLVEPEHSIASIRDLKHSEVVEPCQS